MFPFLEMIGRADAEFEKGWEKVIGISKSLAPLDETQFALRRLLSYNPSSAAISENEPGLVTPISVMTSVADDLTKQIALSPENEALWVRLGHCYILMSDYPNALASYGHARDINPKLNDPYFWFAYGVVFHHLMYYNDAFDCYNQSTKCTTQLRCPADFNFRLAVLYRKLGRHKEALEAFESIKNDPPKKLNKDDIIFQIAFTHQVANNNEAAYQIYCDLYNRHPDSLEIIQQLTWFISTLNKKEQLDFGLKIIQNAPSHYASDPRVKIAGARILMAAEDLKESYTRFCECLTYWNDNPVLWCGLSELYFKNNQFDDADVALHRVICLNPGIPEAWLNLSYVYESRFDKKTAMKHLTEATIVCSDSQEIKDRFSDLQRGKFAGQVVPFKKMSFFTQIAEKEGTRRISDSIDIPAEMVSTLPDVQEAIDALSDRRSTIFPQ